MNADYSKTNFLQFLSWIGDKGDVKPETARTWRVAAAKLLDELTPAEEADVRTIDVNLAAHRAFNRDPGSLTSSSLNLYRQRVGLAIREFERWVQDPAGYRARVMNGKSRGKPVNGKTSKPNSSGASAKQKPTDASVPNTIPASDGLTLTIPLRAGSFVVRVTVPGDLTVKEARKIGTNILTVADDFDPDTMQHA